VVIYVRKPTPQKITVLQRPMTGVTGIDDSFLTAAGETFLLNIPNTCKDTYVEMSTVRERLDFQVALHN
jgi:hypothetical protein